MLEKAKALRTNQTDAEQRLWYHLRAHRFMGLKFKRQKPIGRYIVDFVCMECGLIVELDGGQHAENVKYDQQRDEWLRGRGFTVLRFWNNDVMQQLESVLEQIRLVALSRKRARGAHVQLSGFSGRRKGIGANAATPLYPSPACGRG